MPTSPRRRWFQFSMIALFVVVAVVAIPLGWLGWEWRYVRDRRALRAMAIETAGEIGYQPLNVDQDFEYYGEKRTVPFWRRWMGDEDAFSLVLPQDAVQEMNKADLLFPELKGDWLWTMNGWRTKYRAKLEEPDATSAQELSGDQSP